LTPTGRSLVDHGWNEAQAREEQRIARTASMPGSAFRPATTLLTQVNPSADRVGTC
jgi:hypothetical protein